MLIKLANAITRPVIELYELIKHIVDKGRGKKVALSFKPTNYELNQLHLTFNSICKTMYIANEIHSKDNAQTGILNYWEAYGTFLKYKNYQAMGMCQNNIGCLEFI